MEKLTIVKLTWRDPTSSDPWSTIEEVVTYQPHHIVTIGILIGETESCFITASNLDLESQDVSLCMIIPKVCLVKPLEVIDE
jgi:hypothetical protein